MKNKKLFLSTMIVIFLISIAFGCAEKEKAPEVKDNSSLASEDSGISNISSGSMDSTNESDSTNNSSSTLPVSIIENNSANDSSSSSPTATVSISSPVNGDTVKYTELVSGTSTNVSGSSLHLYVLVNPIETGEQWWVQPEVTVSSDGSWQTLVYFGDNTDEHIGKEYRVSAIVTSEELAPGELDQSPLVKCRVDKDILVTRG